MYSPRRRSFALLLSAPVLFSLVACQSLYYKAMEQVGLHARDILVERVVETREVQVEAQEQFQTALEAFQDATGFEGGDIESYYNKIKKEYDRSVDRADDVRGKIDSVESASKKLFSDWEGEISEITDSKLRGNAEGQLRQSEARYEDLITKMRNAEAKMDPVLAAFKDRVLTIKSSLNFSAINSLEGTLGEIEDDVADLIADMKASIDEADEFIAEMDSSAPEA